MSNIFSTYSTGENRVTASILAVLRSLSLDRIERLLGDLLGQPEFELVRFENQPSYGADGVPDAIIHSSIRLLVETKIKTNSVSLEQIKRHLKRLDEMTEATKLLLVITPDDTRPQILDSLSDDRVSWASFASLDKAIDDTLEDKYEVVSEREEFLLRELQNMFEAEELVASANDVVVVAALRAWPFYNRFHAYICQPHRAFQRVNRVAFFSKGFIHEIVPEILEKHEDVALENGLHTGLLGKLIERILIEEPHRRGNRNKVILLSDPESTKTIRLDNPIENDQKSKTGKPTPFTMNQRYVKSQELQKASRTSDLVHLP